MLGGRFCVSVGDWNVMLKRDIMAWLTLLLAAPLLASCAASRGGDIPYETANFGRPDVATLGTDQGDYRLGALDTINVQIFQVPDLSGDVQVDIAGNVTLPLVGEVKAAGLTTKELSTNLAQRYGAQYLQNPTVFVTVKAANAQQITVDGSVTAPGIYPVTPSMTLIQAIALAKGTNDKANPRRIVIFRQIEGQRMAAAFDLTDIRRGKMEDPKVFGNDIIVVDGSGTRSAFRDILSAIPLFSLFRPF